MVGRNEQVRTSYMLCEAHRERKEKIRALQTQLECKNLAGLMYVLCSERRRSKFEKMQMAQGLFYLSAIASPPYNSATSTYLSSTQFNYSVSIYS